DPRAERGAVAPGEVAPHVMRVDVGLRMQVRDVEADPGLVLHVRVAQRNGLDDEQRPTLTVLPDRQGRGWVRLTDLVDGGLDLGRHRHQESSSAATAVNLEFLFTVTGSSLPMIRGRSLGRSSLKTKSRP